MSRHTSTPQIQNLAAAAQLHPHGRPRPPVRTQLWYIVQATLFGASPHFMYGWRRWLLRRFGARIGSNVRIRPSARVTYPWNVTVGEESYIGDEVVLYSLDTIDIGAHVSISYRGFVCTGTHDHNDPEFPLVLKPVTIEDQSWLAADVFVAPGVKVGRGAVVGARSSVFKDVPPMEVWVGNPATRRGRRGVAAAAAAAV